ncbi:CMRF35-like molecule 8 isoform X1 [Pseudorasbora parva]|uniref:CMRF35-like molecule 8 isoform X1 n=1 Tax=Pseudorasbora parva TaxID=51549 RepID=UPI00351E1525
MIPICDHKLLIFNLLLMSVVAWETEILTFTAHERGKVEIRCPYETGYETNEKYLCRGKCSLLNKDIPVDSGSGAKDKRFSLTDDRRTHIFTVTITDLRTDDEGQYLCVVKTGLGRFDDYREIRLEVKPVSVVPAETGQHLDIICRYKNDLKNNDKFICKGSDPSLCETSGIKVSSKTNINGRFSLRDDQSAGVFTVTITDLTLEDSGIYWCGAAETRQKNKWISVTELKIHEVTLKTTSAKPTTTSADHTSKPTAAETASNRPVTSVFPQSSSSSSSSSISPSVRSPSSNISVSSKPEPEMMSFTMLVLMVVLGILTVFGFSLFMCFRWRQKKEEKQPRDVVQGPTEHLPNGDATHAVSDYEEILNTLDHPDYSLVFPVLYEHDASVYALAQLPSSPSDDLNYSTVKFSATLHSNRTSDGPETCEYATVMP